MAKARAPSAEPFAVQWIASSHGAPQQQRGGASICLEAQRCRPNTNVTKERGKERRTMILPRKCRLATASLTGMCISHPSSHVQFHLIVFPPPFSLLCSIVACSPFDWFGPLFPKSARPAPPAWRPASAAAALAIHRATRTHARTTVIRTQPCTHSDKEEQTTKRRSSSLGRATQPQRRRPRLTPATVRPRAGREAAWATTQTRWM